MDSSVQSVTYHNLSGERLPEVRVGSLIQEEIDNLGVPIYCSLIFVTFWWRKLKSATFQKCSQVSRIGTVCNQLKGFVLPA